MTCFDQPIKQSFVDLCKAHMYDFIFTPSLGINFYTGHRKV